MCQFLSSLFNNIKKPPPYSQYDDGCLKQYC
nr:MAG TPA: hypothetical protein [Caudoviricetes sp.]